MRRSAILALAAFLTACSSAPRQRDAAVQRSLEPRAQTAQTSAGRSARVSPPAALNARPITWDDMHDALVEAAGAVVLEEVTLDRLLAAEAQRRGVRVENVDLENEERALLNSLARAANSSSETAVLEELRRRRGLGPHRYRALLRRTAIMRALVAPDVNITEEQLELARAIRFGEKRRVRLITAPSLLEAQTALRAIQRGEAFPEVAARLSTDPSAPRGGLLDPISTADPSYPAAIRDAAKRLDVGAVSPALAIDGGYAVLKLEEIIPERAPRDAGSILLEDARAEQERVLMTALARRLLAEASLNLFDPALETAWRRRGNQ